MAKKLSRAAKLTEQMDTQFPQREGFLKHRGRGLLSIGKAAVFLGISIDTLRNWEEQGKISPIRESGSIRRYRLSEIKNLLIANPGLIRKQKKLGVTPTFTRKKEIGLGKTLSTRKLLELRERKFNGPVIPIPETAIDLEKEPTEPDIVISEAIHKHLSLKRPFITAGLTVVFLCLILTGALTAGYIISPQKVSQVMNQEKLSSKALAPFDGVAKTAISLFFPYQAEQIALAELPPTMNQKPLTTNLPEVLSASTLANEGKYLEINADIIQNGNLAVEGEGIFAENLTAPNIIYDVLPGTGIIITEGQTPTISVASEETLATVTARGSTTTTGITLGNILNLGQLSSEPSSAVNGATYYNSTSNKLRCYQNGSWKDCDTDTTNAAFGGIKLAGSTGTTQTISDGDTITIAAGNGLTTTAAATDIVTIDLDVTTTSTTTTTSANSGLETSSTGLSLLRGCSNNQALLWTSSTAVWSCSGVGAGSISDDSLDFAQFEDTMDVDAATDINLSTFALTIDLDSTGDFSIRDVATDIATFADTGAITFDPTDGQALTANLGAASNVQIIDSAAPTVDLLSIVSDAATTTSGVNALEIDFTTGDGTDLTHSGIQIDLVSGGTASTDIILGLNLTMDAADTSTQRAINIADNNFDSDINALTDLTLGIGGTNEVTLTSSAFSPSTSDSNALGTTSLMWSDLFLASGGVINFNAGDVTITHSTDTLTIASALTITATDVTAFNCSDCIDFDDIADALTIDAATTIAYTGAGTSLALTNSGAKTAASTGTSIANTSTSATDSINKYALQLSSTGSWSGTSAYAIGAEIQPVTGGTNNVALCFDCDGTFGTSTVASGIQFGTDANTVTLYRSASDILRTGDGFTVDLDLIVTGNDITFGNGETISDATDNTIILASNAASGAGVARLPVKTDTGDPSLDVEGNIYYNTFDNKFRCYQSAAWTDCISAGASSLQTAYNTATIGLIETDSTNPILFRETTAEAHGTVDILQITSNPATGGTFAGDNLQITVDGVDASSNTGRGIAISLSANALGAEGIDLTTTSGVRTVAAIDLNENNTTGSVPTITWDSAETRGGLLAVNATGALGTENLIDINTTAAFTSNLIDITTATAASSGNMIDLNYGAVADTGDAINVALGATAVSAQALVVTSSGASSTAGWAINVTSSGAWTGNMIDLTSGAQAATGNYIDINVGSAAQTGDVINTDIGALAVALQYEVVTNAAASSTAGWLQSVTTSAAWTANAIDFTTGAQAWTGNVLDINFGNAAATGDVININNPALAVATQSLVIDNAAASSTAGWLIDVNATGAFTANAIDIDTTAAFSGNIIDITTATAASSGNLIDLNFGDIADTGDAINVSMGAAAVGAQALVVSTSAGVRTQSAIQLTENNTTGTVASIDIDGSSTRGGAIDLDWSGILTTEHLVDIDANSIAAVSIIDITANGLTTGSGIAVASSGTIASGGELLSLSATGITAGRILDISSAANTLTTGQLVNIASSATSITGTTTTGSLLTSTATGVLTSSFVGNLNYFSWEPGSAATAAGDIFRINIGTNGTTTGNLFNVTDANSSIFALSEVALTTSLPSNFTSPGDVSIAYDILFTNPTASYIKSNAPLNITAGEIFGSSDLTLTTYGYGSVIVDTTFTPIASASKYGLYVNTNSLSQNVADTAYSIYSVNTMLGNGAKVGYGIYSTLTANSTTADTTYGGYFTTVQSGATTTAGTKNTYGVYSLPSTTGANTSGATAINIYGGYFAPSSTASTTATVNVYGQYITNTGTITSTGTVNSYGLYIADGTSNTTGTSTKLGINIDPMTSADENIALCFDCDTTFGTQTAATGIQFGNESTTTQNLQIFRSNAAAAAQITIQDEAGTDLMNASTADFQINLGANIASGGQRVCHGGAADSTGLESIGDCNATSVDLAEYYGSDGTLESGDVVIVDPAKPAFEFTTPTGSKTSKAYVTKSTNSYQQSLVGIVSTNPLEILGEGVFDQSENPVPVALVGRVPVKVSNENGPIEPGDYLTSSSVPGVAMKATRPGQVIGKALEPFSGTQGETLQGKIIAFVNVTFADPNEALANLLLDEEGYLVIPKLKTDTIYLGNIGSIDLTQTQLTVGTQPIDLIAKLTVIDSIQSTVDSLQTEFATQSAQLASNISALDEIKANVASLYDSIASASASLQNDTQDVELGLTPPDILLATGSATLADLKVTETFSSEKLLTALDATVSGTFKALSDVFLGTTTVAGDLTVDGTLSFTGSSINSLSCRHPEFISGSQTQEILNQVQDDDECGILYIQNNPLATLVDIFNGKVTIDKDGTLKVETILASEYQVIAGKTSGSGTLAAGTFEVPIFAERVGPNSRILITSTTPTTLTLSVSEKVPGAGFVVSTTVPAPRPVTFDWWIINEVAEVPK